MTLFDIPFLNGYKTALGGWGMLLGGLGGLLALLSQLLQGQSDVLSFMHATGPSLLMVSAGLSVLGIGHKLEKAAGQ